MSFLQATLVFLFLSGIVLSIQAGGLSCGARGVVCFGLPTGCADHNAAAGCEVLAKLNASANNMVHVELSAMAGGSMNLAMANRWIGVGFSADGQMSKSPVVHCFEDHGKAVAKLTFNKDNGYGNAGWEDIDQTQMNPRQLLVDGHTLTCSVDVKSNLHIKSFSFNLSGQQYSLIAATGPMDHGHIAVHDQAPETSYPVTYSFHA